MTRARVYRHDLRCPHCGSNWTPRDGHSRGKQTYRCRDCHHRFTPDGNRHCFPEAVKRQALDTYAEGTGITATGRIPGVQQATVFSWVKKARQAQELMEGTDGADDHASGGASAGKAVGPGDFLRRNVELCGSAAGRKGGRRGFGRR